MQPLVGQFDAVAFDARENDFERRALLDRLDAEDRIRREDRRGHGLGGECERDAEDVGIFDSEQIGRRVQIVRLPAQRAADDLLAEKLGSEGADANDVGHCVRVPPLRQHRYGDDAADAFAEPTRFADRVHNLAQQLGIRDCLRGRASAFAGGLLALELFDFRSREFAERGIERVAGLDLFAVYEQRIRLGQAVAKVIEVPK